MTNFPKWQDVRDDIVAGAGGEQAVAGARHRNQAYIDGYRPAERRKALGLTQADVAERMSVTKKPRSRRLTQKRNCGHPRRTAKHRMDGKLP